MASIKKLLKILVFYNNFFLMGYLQMPKVKELFVHELYSNCDKKFDDMKKFHGPSG